MPRCWLLAVGCPSGVDAGGGGAEVLTAVRPSAGTAREAYLQVVIASLAAAHNGRFAYRPWHLRELQYTGDPDKIVSAQCLLRVDPEDLVRPFGLNRRKHQTETDTASCFSLSGSLPQPSDPLRSPWSPALIC